MFTASFSNNQNQGGGLFNANQNKPQTGLFQSFAQPSQPQGQAQTQAPGLFGGGNQQQQQGGGLFGQSNPQFGSTSQQFQQNSSFQGGSMFGQSNVSQGGIFGQPQQQNTSGIFGQPSQNPPAGGGLFTNTTGSQGNQGGIFGQGQGAQGAFGQGTQGAFGQAQTSFNQGGQGIFGQPQNTFGQAGQSQGLFGQQSQPQGGTGGLFSGGTTQGATSTGLFGATSGQSFLGNQPQQQGSSLFPGTPTQIGSSLFGANPQQQPTQAGGTGLFGSFTPATGQTSAFNAASTNKFGGTSWGVPTPTQPTTQPVVQNMQPVKSKNAKLDNKHLVKCIAALDQFQGCCKEQVRINFINSGGQQPNLGQAPGSAGFAKPAAGGTGPLTSLPSFGGSTSLFGGQTQQQPQQGTGMFAKPQNQGTSLFGATQQQTGTGLFGQSAQQTQQSAPGLFGATSAAQGTSLFGATGQQQQPGTSLFGAAGQQQQTTSLFGQQSPQPTSLFGGQPQTTSIFGQTALGQQQTGPQPSLFGQSQPQATTSLFGQPQAGGAPSLFNSSAPLQPPPSLFNPSPPTAPAGGQPLFGQHTLGQQPFPQMMPSPYGCGLGPNPFNAPFPPQQGQQMDPNIQLLLPQLLLGYALAQSQNQGQQGQGTENPTLELINKLVTNLSLSKQPDAGASKNISTLLNPTPFDQFLKEESTSRRSELPNERRSLFSEAQIRQFQNLDSSSFMDRAYPSEFNEESYQLKNRYKPSSRKPDPLGEGNYRVISRSYKAAQQQARRKYTPTADQLPEIGSYNISPSFQKIKNLTVNQLKKVDKVKISNSFGSIQFLEPISLYKLDIPISLKIAQDNIEIVDPELEEKKVRMTFNNFGSYRSLKAEERTRLVKKMRMWIEQFDMTQISHDTDTGQLVVETND